MRRFEGKNVMVTGGGRGIGAAICTRFASEGARVAVCDIDQTLGAATAARLQAAGAESIAVKLDVCDPESVDAAVSEVEHRWNVIDILINNAGITIAKPVLDFEESEWNRMIEINLKGVLRCSQRVARGMVDRGSGAIINIASE
jgi:2-hydroxycyclohexanecarboxyl-CoA dehydrogenase